MSITWITPLDVTGKARAIRFSTLQVIYEVLACHPGDLLEFQTDPGARKASSSARS